MKRAVVAVILAGLCPVSASAQNIPDFDRPGWGPRLRMTPFVGFAPTVNRYESWVVTSTAGSASADYDVSLASGPAAGLTMEIRAFGRFGVAFSGAMISRGRTVEQAVGSPEYYEHEGSDYLLGKAALVVRLREESSSIQMHSLTGSIFVGPSWVREIPRDDPFTAPALLDPLDHMGLAFGFDAEVPMPWNHLSFTAGLDDYVIWWNALEMGRRNDAIFASDGIETVSFVETRPTHNLLLRAGFSLRF